MGCKKSEKPKQKQKHKKGLWSPEEDLKLTNYINNYGHSCWSSVPINAGLQRNGKSCRLRWINYLRPGLKRGAFSVDEEKTIMALHRVLGNKWSQIANHLTGRTDNEIKNHWHSYLKKRVSKLVEGKTEQLELSSPSSFKSARQNSTSESSENIEASSTDTDQSMQQTESEKFNLPRVMFAEWLSLDQFNIPSQRPFSVSADLDCTLDHGSTNSGDSSYHGEQINPETNLISIDDILQSPFGFEGQIPEGGVVDYFSGVFNFSCDEMYI